MCLHSPLLRTWKRGRHLCQIVHASAGSGATQLHSQNTAGTREIFQRYSQLVANGSLTEDEKQVGTLIYLKILGRLQSHPIIQKEIIDVFERLSSTIDEFAGQTGASSGGIGLLSRLSGLLTREESRSVEMPRGVYLHGAVGRGKTMLMDLFAETITGVRKRRVHFHSFMQDFHSELHRLKLQNTGHGSRFDPVPLIADSIIDASQLLCFDEFQASTS